MIYSLIGEGSHEKEKKKNKYQIYDMKNSLPEEIFDEKEVVKQNLELSKEETEEEL